MTVAVLREEPQFGRWVVAEAVSMVGTAVSTVAMPALVYDLTGSAGATGALFGLRALPYLVFGLLAGPIADRGNRRLLIIGGNFLEGLLTAWVPLAWALGVLSLWQVYVVAILSATVSTFSDAAVFGAVPALVGRARLAAANGLLGSLASATDILGPIVAAGLLVTLGLTGALWLDAASFVVAAAVQLTVRSDFREGGVVERRTVAEQLARAGRFIRGERTVSTLLGVGFANSFAFGIVLGLLVPYAFEELGVVDPDDARLGVLYAAIGVGSLVTSLAFSRLFAPARVPVLTPSGLLAAGVTAALLAVAATWLVSAGLLVVFSASIALTIVTGITYRQLAAPDDLRSTVNVVGRMIAWGGQPFGAFVGSAVATWSSTPVAYWLASGIMVTAAIAARLSLGGDRSWRAGGGPAIMGGHG